MPTLMAGKCTYLENKNVLLNVNNIPFSFETICCVLEHFYEPKKHLPMTQGNGINLYEASNASLYTKQLVNLHRSYIC